jgi:hypothetical protein
MAKQIRPSYYTVTLPDGYVLELRSLIEALKMNFNRGNALKYLCRAGRKPGCERDDITKTVTYAMFEQERLECEAAAEPAAEPARSRREIFVEINKLARKLARNLDDDERARIEGEIHEFEEEHERLARAEMRARLVAEKKSPDMG